MLNSGDLKIAKLISPSALPSTWPIRGFRFSHPVIISWPLKEPPVWEATVAKEKGSILNHLLLFFLIKQVNFYHEKQIRESNPTQWGRDCKSILWEKEIIDYWNHTDLVSSMCFTFMSLISRLWEWDVKDTGDTPQIQSGISESTFPVATHLILSRVPGVWHAFSKCLLIEESKWEYK